MIGSSRARARAALPAASVVVGFAVACGLVLALGFDHVSDDDYARVTIAESFAHAPRLDPSGTSWLPFHFWALGTGLTVLGRSLVAARVVSIALASFAALLPYRALRIVGLCPPRALVATAFALLSPWSLWLGASTVPESFAASATAAAAIALPHPDTSPRARLGFAAALLAACLSRYEAWPVAALLAIVLLARARGQSRRPFVIAALLAAVGPLAWMLWNLHAHGDALHFFARVSRFKRAIGEGATDTTTALLLYPRLFAWMRPDALLAGLAGIVIAARAPLLRARWRVPLACAAAQLAFLAIGNARDGAPAHHAERALLAVTFLVAIFAVDALTTLSGRALMVAAALAVALWAMTTAHALSDVPGKTEAENRAPQIERGRTLRGETGTFVVEPCAYEHFALIAAFGAPERVESRPPANTPVTAACPVVTRQ